MIINEALKIVYLHNPKTGGTFFRESYGQNYSNDEAYKYWKMFDEKFNVDLGHIDYNCIARFVPDYRAYRIITVIRNPYKRFVSGWKEVCLHHSVIAAFSIENPVDFEKNSGHILSLNFHDQNLFLQNRQNPWQTPLSWFIRKHTIVLRHENPIDWLFLLNVFGVYCPEVMLRNDYKLSETA